MHCIFHHSLPLTDVQFLTEAICAKFVLQRNIVFLIINIYSNY